MRTEVAKLRAEVEAEERDEKPKRKRRRPKLRLIKGGGVAALIAAPLGRHWREAAAAGVVGAAAAGVLALPSPGPGPGPDDLRIPETTRSSTGPVKVSPEPLVPRSSRLPARSAPSERKGTVAPKTSSERRAVEEITPEFRLGTELPSVSLPPLPTLSLPVRPGSCLVTVGTFVSICVPTVE